uniref:beta'' subunit of RNA polymerase n=1 Tax=Calidiella yingdensis TaxID=3031288 RepID=UPI00241121D1|nr:beta'' subunit of RNA polymerase [Calidiella yingdensis]WDY13098.1 beta'' subunit of RNA polymerase [Calidiella yingdensis]
MHPVLIESMSIIIESYARVTETIVNRISVILCSFNINAIYATHKQKLNHRILRLLEMSTKSINQRAISGEVFKDHLIDVFLTNSEQIAFSLTISNKITALSSSDPTYAVALDSLRTRGQTKSDDPVLTSHTRGTEEVSNSDDKTIKHEKSQKLENSSLASVERVRAEVQIAKNINCGDKLGENSGRSAIARRSGKVIRISKKQIIVQKTQVLLFYSETSVHVKQGDWVKRGAPILTLTNNTLITGDIVQGIPRIEQLFEAPNSPPLALRTGDYVYNSLHSQIIEIFRKNWLNAPLPIAVRTSLQEMQQILIESIQKVYLSQGVLIADKHIEIVVAQMTTRAQIIDSGSTGLFLEEVLSVREIENANLATPGKKALYAPTVMGLTKSALNSDSFLSAASFQETSRVLSRDAVIGKSDFLRGLKEKVVVGDLICAGTGLDVYFIYTLLCNKQFSHLLKHPKTSMDRVQYPR